MWSKNYVAYFTVMYVIHANCTFELQAFQVQHIGGGINYLCRLSFSDLSPSS